MSLDFPECDIKLFRRLLMVPSAAPLSNLSAKHIVETVSYINTVDSCDSCCVFVVVCLCTCLSVLKWVNSSQGEWPPHSACQCHAMRACPRSLNDTVHKPQTLSGTCLSALMIKCCDLAKSSALPWPWHIYSTWHGRVVCWVRVGFNKRQQRVGLISLPALKGWMVATLVSPITNNGKICFSK